MPSKKIALVVAMTAVDESDKPYLKATMHQARFSLAMHSAFCDLARAASGNDDVNVTTRLKLDA
jgi:hypothetical protein